MTGGVMFAIGAAAFLCALTAGFLLAFAVVVMPGLRPLADGDYLRAFQLLDGVIQNGQPLFMLMWAGSIVAVLAALVLGVVGLTGPPRLLVVGAAVLYLVGVQLPTVAINIPLNNAVQELEIDQLDDVELSGHRAGFEQRWNRANVFRTVVAGVSVVLLLVALGVASPASAQESAARSPSESALTTGARDMVKRYADMG